MILTSFMKDLFISVSSEMLSIRLPDLNSNSDCGTVVPLILDLNNTVSISLNGNVIGCLCPYYSSAKVEIGKRY